MSSTEDNQMSLSSKMHKEIVSIIKEALPKGMSYNDYRELVLGLAESGDTTGEKTASNINYTLLNNRRMKRWDKTLRLSEEQQKSIQGFNRKVIWMVLTESWCGDAAPTIPAMNKIASQNENIVLKVLLRDENPGLMDQFLNNGARAIPKLIMLDAHTADVLGEWGSRPAVAAKMVADYKQEHGKLTAEFREDLQTWYNKDKGQETLKELIDLLALVNVGDGANL